MKNSSVRVLVRWLCVLALGLVASDTTYAARSFPESGSPQATANQLTHYGITWTFDRGYEFGQFANGDYWVVGPLTIMGISPPSTEMNGRTMNGSMVNPSPKTGATQGYDSAMYGSYGPYYDPALNVALNVSPSHALQLPSGSSLVSTISITTAGNRPQLQTAAILTVLPSAPPQGSFRPPYSGADKTIRYNTSQLNYAQLARLAPVTGTLSLATVERYFERPWIDHVPNWLGGYHHPESNMPNYGREMAAQVGIGALMLHLDFSNAQKETLLVRYVQLGIDLYGVIQDGGQANWVPNGGHASGRKWPILFAGLVLGDANMMHIGPGDGSGVAAFGEDGQTFYVSQEDIDCAHTPDLRGCYLSEYEPGNLGLPEWGIVHSTNPVADNQAWCAIYRQCCTANAWAGFVLAAHIMDAKGLWEHDALFDYQDRYMANEPRGAWTRCWDDFTEEMWDRYRADYGLVWPGLELHGAPTDETIHLAWNISGTLPTTITWRIEYYTQTVTSPLTISDILSPTRVYTLTDLTNYAWYTVTLNAMLNSTPFLTDTIKLMPTDRLVYLPLILDQVELLVLREH